MAVKVFRKASGTLHYHRMHIYCQSRVKHAGVYARITSC